MPIPIAVLCRSGGICWRGAWANVQGATQGGSWMPWTLQVCLSVPGLSSKCSCCNGLTLPQGMHGPLRGACLRTKDHCALHQRHGYSVRYGCGCWSCLRLPGDAMLKQPQGSRAHWPHSFHTQNYLHTGTGTCPPSESRKVLNSSSNRGGPGVLGLRSTTRLAPCIAVMNQ